MFFHFFPTKIPFLGSSKLSTGTISSGLKTKVIKESNMKEDFNHENTSSEKGDVYESNGEWYVDVIISCSDCGMILSSSSIPVPGTPRENMQ